MPITIGNTTYTDQQIKDFYAQGGNDIQFAQQAGMTDLGAIHDLAVQARGIGGAPTGDAALQQQFQRYQQANPQGAYANNYQGFVNDLGAGTANAIRAGTYTGASIAPTDYTPGGIYGPGSAAYGQPGYASGLGPRGQGGSWSQPPAPVQQQVNQAREGMIYAGGSPSFNMANQVVPGQSSWYQNYGKEGMFGGTATSRQPMTGYRAYQPYQGQQRTQGMFGAPTMNYNMRNKPMQQQEQQSWSQNNPWSQ